MRLAERRGRAGSGNHQRRMPAADDRLKPPMRPAQFAGNELLHPRQSLFGRRVGDQKLLGQPHRAQRQADRFLDAPVLAQGDLATAAADIHQQHFARRARLVG